MLYRHSSVNHRTKVFSQPIVRSVNSEHYKQTLDATKQAIVYNMILPLNITVIPLLLGKLIGIISTHFYQLMILVRVKEYKIAFNCCLQEAWYANDIKRKKLPSLSMLTYLEYNHTKSYF